MLPQYVDVAVRRWQKYTGKVARLAGTGQTFEEVEEQRGLSSPEAVVDQSSPGISLEQQ